MQKRAILGVIISVVALDCYIKHHTFAHGKPVEEATEKREYKLLQKLKKA